MTDKGRQESSPELPGGEGWPDYRHHVLGSLDRLEKTDDEQSKVLQEIKTAIAVLSTKVTLYAAGVALLVSAIVEFAAKLLGKP